jgi:hypothetical protein
LSASTNSSGRLTDTPKQAERVRFSLSGHSRPFDPLHQAIRPDLADVAEAEHHFAPHYAKPAPWQAKTDAIVRDSAKADGAERARLAAGDDFALLDITGGWAWGYTAEGHVVGYVEAALIAPVSSSAA